MLNNCKSLMHLVSLLSFSWAAFGQSAPNECSGLKQTPTEALIQHDEPLCHLGRAPSCERIPKSNADTIFIGTVIRLEKVDGFEVVNGECSHISVDLATLRVKESFTGPLPETVTINAGAVNGYYFNRNETALVFAHRNQDGTLSVSGCGGTESLTEWYTHGPRENPIAKEDIAYLRARSTMPLTGRIFGNVWLTPPDTGRMVPAAIGFGDQTITVSGPLSAKLETSKSGEFHLDNLPPGKYVVRVSTSKKVLDTLQDHEIEMPAKSCARFDFYIESADDYRNATKSFRKTPASHP